MSDPEIERMMIIGSIDGTDDVVEENQTLPSMDSVLDEEQSQPTQTAPSADGKVKYAEDKITSISDVILQNSSKLIKCQVVNDAVHAVNADADVKNYIVYVNTDKKIPCVYDCERLYVPTSVVKDSNNNWNITSIEGRRSGFVIKVPGHDLVMTKNFIYDCTLDNAGNIANVMCFSRVHKDGLVGEPEGIRNASDIDADSAKLYIKTTLPKLYKNSSDLTVPQIKAAVVNEYNNVNDINAMVKIITLRLQLGC